MVETQYWPPFIKSFPIYCIWDSARHQKYKQMRHYIPYVPFLLDSSPEVLSLYLLYTQHPKQCLKLRM
jgi:hypothetical protein